MQVYNVCEIMGGGLRIWALEINPLLSNLIGLISLRIDARDCQRGNPARACRAAGNREVGFSNLPGTYNNINNLNTINTGFSDHSMITFTYSTKKIILHPNSVSLETKKYLVKIIWVNYSARILILMKYLTMRTQI